MCIRDSLVAGGSIKLVFNPAIVNAASVSSGDISGSLVPNINNTAGFVFATVAGSTAVGTSSEMLMNIKFTGISAGTTSLTITSADLNYQDGSLVTPTTTSGSITVTGGLPALVSSITPNSRNAQLGTPVTLFMSVINYGTATATGVSIEQALSLI